MRKKTNKMIRSHSQFMREMKQRPAPGPSLHGFMAYAGAVSDLLDDDLIDGACSPIPVLRCSLRDKVADLSDIDLDALDAELAALTPAGRQSA